MAESKKGFSIEWPRSASHTTKSASGVVVESNLQRQIAIHFFNEIRQLDGRIEYDEEGARQNVPEGIVYVREILETLLVSDAVAIQLRDSLNTFFPPDQKDSPVN